MISIYMGLMKLFSLKQTLLSPNHLNLVFTNYRWKVENILFCRNIFNSCSIVSSRIYNIAFWYSQTHSLYLTQTKLFRHWKRVYKKNCGWFISFQEISASLGIVNLPSLQSVCGKFKARSNSAVGLASLLQNRYRVFYPGGNSTEAPISV